jgi:hypothetical protein
VIGGIEPGIRRLVQPALYERLADMAVAVLIDRIHETTVVVARRQGVGGAARTEDGDGAAVRFQERFRETGEIERRGGTVQHVEHEPFVGVRERHRVEVLQALIAARHVVPEAVADVVDEALPLIQVGDRRGTCQR